MNETNSDRLETPSDKPYPHAPSKRRLITIIAVTGLCAVYEGYSAITNNRGLLINGIIRLGPTGATIFYYAMMALFGAACLGCAAMAMQVIVNPHSVTLRPDGIIFSLGWLKPAQTFVPFAGMHTIAQRQKTTRGVAAGPRTLVLTFDGREFLIHEAWVGKQVYNGILARIVSAAKERGPIVLANTPTRPTSPQPSAR